MARGQRGKWWRRVGSSGKNFRYVDAGNLTVADAAHLERIKSLVIPPAWKFVRICPNQRGKIQAVGIDANGRLQYKYNPKFAAEQQELKFAKVTAFGYALPKLRAQTNRDLELEGYPKNKILAIIIRLINDLYIRIGSEKSVELYKTYGVTTLRNTHLQIRPNGELFFNFIGKHHIRHRQVLVDEELATMMRDLKSFGGKKLFNYADDSGHYCPIKPADVNNYIKNATEKNFSAKDFRTWGATLLAAQELAELGAAETKTQINKNIVRMVKTVAERLGNTPAVCRKSYIHPRIIEDYEKGVTLAEFISRKSRRINHIQIDLQPDEKALLKMLEAEI